MTTLTFNDVNFHPVAQNDGQIWLTSVELAKALGYSDVRSVTKIFNRNIDEFTDKMTLVVKLTTNGINGSLREKAVRIFSLRGCHLIAMLSSGKFAKAFRKWVLDILDKNVGEPVITQITDEKINEKQAYQLKSAVEKRCKANSEHYQTVWTALKHRFEVSSYKNILAKDFDNAMNLVWTVSLPQPTLQIEQDSMRVIHDISRLGIAKSKQNQTNFDLIEKALTLFDYAFTELKKNNATHHGVFENIFTHSI